MVKAYTVYTIVLLFALSIVIQPALATPITAIPFMSTDSAVFIEPLSIATCTIEEFNSASVIGHSSENLSISFPLFTDDSVLGPSVFHNGAVSDDTGVSGLHTSNVLPFGPVNLAFPSITQTANDSMAAQRTYFFSDTFS